MEPTFGLAVRYHPHAPIDPDAQALDTTIVPGPDGTVAGEVCGSIDSTAVDLRLVDAQGAVHYRTGVQFVSDGRQPSAIGRYCVPAEE